MPDLSCPRCGLQVPASQDEEPIEHCPRCLARTAGALSVPLGTQRQGNRTSRAVRSLTGRIFPAGGRG